jgi:antitoxin VapB
MALSIKNPKADRLAKQLAKATGQSVTDAVIGALETSLKIATVRRPALVPAQEVADLQAFVAELPDQSKRSPHDVIEYDDHGLPI